MSAFGQWGADDSEADGFAAVVQAEMHDDAGAHVEGAGIETAVHVSREAGAGEIRGRER